MTLISIRLRLQTSKGQFTVTADPKSKLQTFIQIPEIGLSSESFDTIKIKLGFPPKNIDLSDLNKTLSECGISNGDRLIVDIQEQSGTKRDRSPSTDVIPSILKQAKPRNDYTEVNKKIISYKLPNNTFLIQRKMPADNSCFFRSVAQGYYGDSSLALMLRQNVSNFIKDNKKDYSDVVLGRPLKEYCDWILWETSWGGGIEAEILSKFLGVRIITVEVKTGAKIDLSDQSLDNFMILLYDGSHYDLIAQTSSPNHASTEQDITIFKPFDANVHALSTYIDPHTIVEFSQKFAKTLSKSTPLINLENNDVEFLCKDCNKSFKGMMAVNEHAEKASHVNFGEVHQTDR